MRSQYAMCCGTPLSGALVFSGSEYYCVVCGNSYPLFGVPNRRDATPELESEYERNRSLYIEQARHCIAVGMRRRDCEKCDKGEFHAEHATAEELAASKSAYERLYAGNLAEALHQEKQP